MLIQTSMEARNNRRINHNNISRRGNQSGNRDLASLTYAVPSVGYVLGTVTEEHIMKEHSKNFQDKVKQYVLREFDNPRETIIVVQDIKDPYAYVDMENHTKISKE